MTESLKLDERREVPTKCPDNKIVQWRIFRELKDAQDHATHVMLGEGQRLVGGKDVDSVGEFWWVGVEVDSVERWGHRDAVNKHAE